MPFKKLNMFEGDKIILGRVEDAKPSLHHGSEYSLINALNLGIFSKFVYEPEIPAIQLGLRDLKIKSGPTLKTKKSDTPRLLRFPYLGSNEFFCEKFTVIASLGKLTIDTQGFHYNDDEYNVIVFRGTEFPYPRDLITCLKAPKVEYPHAASAGKVHQGFLHAFDSVKEQIEKIFDVPENRACPTILTGHSLGGAVAQLAAAYIAEKYQGHPCADSMVYTYGSPRVGDAQWVRYFSQVRPFIHFRHRHLEDLIPLLPPQRLDMHYPALAISVVASSAFGLGRGMVEFCLRNSSPAREAFVHHGEEIALRMGIGGKKYLAQGDLPFEVAVASAGGFLGDSNMLFEELVTATRKSGGLGDHGIGQYCDALAAVLKDVVVTWKKDPKILRERAEDLSKTQAAEIAHWEKELVSTRPSAPRDATATAATGRQVSESERMKQIECMLVTARENKVKAELRASIWSAPNAKENALRFIWPGETTEYLEEELDYHFQNIQ